MREAEGRVWTAAPMHLAVVACGQRLEETLTMLKSAVMLSIKPLCLHIFAEDQLHASFIEAVSWTGCTTSPKACDWRHNNVVVMRCDCDNDVVISHALI